MTLKRLILPAVIAGSFLAAGLAQAQVVTKSANMNVKINIKNSCDFGTVSDLDFGSHDATIAANVDASATFQLTCTKNTPYSIALGTGGNGSDVNSRKMRAVATGATETISYQLYKDAARGSVWGDTGAGLVSVTAAASAGGTQTYTVYGRVTAQTAGAAGDYNDIVAITVTY